MIQPPTGESCPACGGRQHRTLFDVTDRLYGTTDERFQIVECSGCRLIRLFPWPDPVRLKGYYPKTYWFSGAEQTAGRLEETYRRLVLRDHVRFVDGALRSLDKSGLVVDVGCGGGLFTRMIREQGYRAIGFDYAPDAARVAWRVNNVPTSCGDLPAAPFRDGSIALITMFHVLEHLYDPAAYLQAAHRLLQPGGKLVIQVPNAACWQFLLFGDRWNGLDAPRHLIDFRSRDVDDLLTGCGFRPTRHKFFSLRDNPAGLATTIAPALDPMARRVRDIAETGGMRLAKDLLYLGMVVAALPFTALEAVCGQGSTVMIEAVKV